MAKRLLFIKSSTQKDSTVAPRFIEQNQERLLKWIRSSLLLLAILAVVSIITDYGFPHDTETTYWLQRLDFFILTGFLGLGCARLILEEDKLQYAKDHWIDLVILVLILLHLILPLPISNLLPTHDGLLNLESLTRFYIILTQFFVLLPLIPPFLRYSQKLMTYNIQPTMLILVSFAILILIGALLLLLPRATVSQPLSFVDALFMSTSAVCVTGLIVVDTATYFTTLGHTILLVLMQIGGLGIMTLTTFFAYILGSDAKLKEYSAMKDLLGEENLGKIRQTVIQIALTTFVIEFLGAISLYGFLPPHSFDSHKEKLFFSIFHAISAFCNAGFALKTDNLMDTTFRYNEGALLTVMSLIVLGGIGFPVLSNMGSVLYAKVFNQKGSWASKRLTVHSKLVLITTGLLLLVGTLGFYLLETNKTLAELPFHQKFLAALFHSVSARTAGFNTVDIGKLATPTLFFMSLLMWIGASPGSTGGGVKTTTAALSLLNIIAIVSGKNRIEVFRKQVSTVAVIKAFSTMLLSIIYIATVLFILLITEHLPLESIAFEIVSALGTVGLSTGITSQLSTFGKIVITITMFFGRIGLLSTLIALTKKRSIARYRYTEENVLVN
ncbi:H(+)-transporting two-sector ATPase [Chloroherpeton thalassium ATCC 35110]|uniref:H(+)-transporting two-sector ATPase n=1 Tax=Chloroherpeton thalassium (strain ATCC 35110 / GB-78) TaxID=517418 RepID=B3QYA4_CHLT3|nr:potassium transporter TrkG [Chloroherpeton thalassium]ACF15070.1 H(+)-transporting two-sector ATPase [Chloroherpeton thalassium ATCC 35110]